MDKLKSWSSNRWCCLDALAGGSHSSPNSEIPVVTGNVRVSRGDFLHFMGKRMGAFIDKAIIVLKALVVFLELIRAFF